MPFHSSNSLGLAFSDSFSNSVGLAFSDSFCRPGYFRADLCVQSAKRRLLPIIVGSMAVGVAGTLYEAYPAGKVRSGRRSGMAIGRSISARVPQGFEMLAVLHLPGQTTALHCRSSSTGAGRIASEPRCQVKLQHAGSRRKPEETLTQLKDPKWKQLVKRVKGFVKRVGKDVKRPTNSSTATLCSVMAVRPVPVPGAAPPKIPIWQRRNLPSLRPLNIYKVRPSRSRSTQSFGM